VTLLLHDRLFSNVCNMLNGIACRTGDCQKFCARRWSFRTLWRVGGVAL